MASSANDEMQAPPPTTTTASKQQQHRISPLEYRNTDLVSRLLAATPPYLYNMSMIPNTYFFSEMLRSFVHAKAERNAGAIARRSRKRSWTQTKADAKPPPPPPTPARVEELAWKQEAAAAHFYEETAAKLAEHKEVKSNYGGFPAPPQPPPPSPSASALALQQQQQQQQADNSSNLILPPPPPIWYPPLYSAQNPYGIDPLHFFIDLRVSGHIYDRKKSLEKDEQTPHSEGISVAKANAFKSSKHASAFSVPTKQHQHPINLSKAEDEHKPFKFDVKSLGLENSCNKTGVNYVMNNIERVYKELQVDDMKTAAGSEAKNKRQLRELIGLELMVDYVNQAKRTEAHDNDMAEIDSASVVEVVDLQDDATMDT